MVVRICDKGEQILYQREIVRLECADEDDAGLKLSFDAVYYDFLGRKYPLGPVKIGARGMESGRTADLLPKEFRTVPKDFFSLGQDESYYENVSRLEAGTRKRLLEALRDLAYDSERLKKLCGDTQEAQMCKALLKRIASDQKVAVAKINGQFRRMTMGGARLTEYRFTYTAPKPEDPENSPVVLRFEVRPKPYPPTNVQALIGRNGCGKTYLIQHMVQCLQEHNSNKEDPQFGTFEIEAAEDGSVQEFVNVICIAFSPFDDFASLMKRDGALPGTFVGFDKSQGIGADVIFEKFWGHFKNCLVTERRQSLWKKAMGILLSDEIFEQEGVGEFMDGLAPESGEPALEERKDAIRGVFQRLSSGHKVVLLIITSCVAEIEERSIVFLDEPENHLHPPLLSALIRALSDLLMDRNGVAIVATHSPVVLQEIPNHCVWVLDRDEFNEVTAWHPHLETLGTNLGSLIYDTFDLQMNKSGFRRLLREAVNEFDNYDQVCREFDGHLGNEAQLFLRTLLMLKGREVL